MNSTDRRTGPGPLMVAVAVVAAAWMLDVFVARPLLAWLLP